MCVAQLVNVFILILNVLGMSLHNDRIKEFFKECKTSSNTSTTKKIKIKIKERYITILFLVQQNVRINFLFFIFE